ncbi:MAG TPA: TonB-dependent receptor [Burkholderiaceae bacterium]|nr:TonB-dependent receptor [Burkholderiaceae bacterium]
MKAMRCLRVGALVLAATLPLHSARSNIVMARAVDLADLSLEELGNVVVTSVSRRQERIAEAPASIYVITREDIRRAGVTSLPEALRLAPNLQVARADTNQYAISARGSNAVLANKLLVLIDGRIVYTPLFSGVFWEAQDTLLEDIDRIEVISGPGAALWGANAVNGVINVITRPTSATQGAVVGAGGGNLERGAFARYGAQIGSQTSFRVYGKVSDRDNSHLTDRRRIRDEAELAQIGFRLDSGGATRNVTVQGDAYRGHIDQVPSERDIRGSNLLGRFSQSFANDSRIVVQAYYDHTFRDHPGIFRENLDTFDLDVQYGFAPFESHSLLMGAGYRHARDRVTNPTIQAFLPASRNLNWAHAFLQDEIALAPGLKATLGVKVEDTTYTDAELMPNVRIAWQPKDDRLVWAALSRAVRTPSRIDREFFVPAAPPFLLAGGPNFESEIANVAELGYRAHFGNRISGSVTGYWHDFDRIRSLEPRAGGLMFENKIEGRTYGVEAWAEYRPIDRWRLSAGLVRQRVKFEREPDSRDTTGLVAAGNDPSGWWQLRSSFDVTQNIELDVRARRISSLPNPYVSAYTAVDLRLGWRLLRQLEASLSIQNAFDPRHAEWGTPANRAEFERAFFLQLVWRQ